MRRISELHFNHTQALFLSERSRREGIRNSLSMPVAAISFAVFACSSLSVEVNLEHWCQLPTFLIFVPGAAAVNALLASAWQVMMAEWLFVYHEPPALLICLVMRRLYPMRDIRKSTPGPCSPPPTPSRMSNI